MSFLLSSARSLVWIDIALCVFGVLMSEWRVLSNDGNRWQVWHYYRCLTYVWGVFGVIWLSDWWNTWVFWSRLWFLFNFQLLAAMGIDMFSPVCVCVMCLYACSCNTWNFDNNNGNNCENCLDESRYHLLDDRATRLATWLINQGEYDICLWKLVLYPANFHLDLLICGYNHMLCLNAWSVCLPLSSSYLLSWLTIVKLVSSVMYELWISLHLIFISTCY